YPGRIYLKQFGDLAGSTFGNYLRSVNYADWALGEFIKHLRKANLYDNTIIVVFGDHQGVNRGNSNVRDIFPIPESDELAWFEFEKRVPFLIHAPAYVQPRVVHDVAGISDIAPSLAGLANIDWRKYPFLGRDFLKEPRGNVIFPDSSAIN